MSTLLELEKDSVNLLSKILKYENEVFNKLIQNRTNLIKNIKNINFENLDKKSLSNFANDLKLIIDPIKASNEYIDAFFRNYPNFENENKNKVISFYFLFKDFFFETWSSELSDDSELSELSESSELSDSSEFSSESV